MIVAKIQVSGAIAHTLYKKVIPAGIIGAQVEFEYAEDVWKGLHKTVVFEGAVTKDVVTDAEVVTIPAEVVAKHGDVLRVGVYGVDADGSIAIPTIWAYIGVVCDSANPSGDTTTDPALPVWAQIQTMIGDLRKLDTTAKENLVAAVNEALTKGGGEVDPAEIQRIVEDYLAANPPSVTESDPTVPAWAKQPNKPTYTAEEVHAMPETYTLPIATETVLGGVKPVTATEAMTQPVGVDAEGRLMTKPGSGGSGIAVSGATVGQTVKISAVDENGVPTAWEPVDFPSGGSDSGDVWEEIYTITLSEDTSSVVISQDKSGNPLSLKKIFVIFNPAYNADKQTSGRIRLHYTCNGVPELVDINLNTARTISALIYMDEVQIIASSHYDASTEYFETYAIKTHQLTRKYMGEPITELKMSYATYYSGSKITIWGVRT